MELQPPKIPHPPPDDLLDSFPSVEELLARPSQPLKVIPPPPPYKPRSIMTWDEIPHRAPTEIIEELRSIIIVDANLSKFKKRRDQLTFDGDEGFTIQDLGGGELMFEAIRRSSTPFITELLNRGVPMSRPYVLTAIQCKAVEALKLFFWNGFDINEPEQMAPPLLAEAVIRSKKLSLWLLEYGADPNRGCDIDKTPLSIATQYASFHLVKVMIDDYGGDVTKGQLLHYAVHRSYDIIEALELLLDRGAPINQTMYANHDWSRRWHHWLPLGTALHDAAGEGRIRAVRYLVNRGIDMSIKDSRGHTALNVAREFDRADIVEFLEGIERDIAKDQDNNASHGDTPGAYNDGKEQTKAENSYCAIM